MILGVGVDIVQVERMRKKAGVGLDTPLAKGVFTAGELEYARGKGVAAAQSLAGFFAAREALFKATQVWPGWHGAWVAHDARGRPYFVFSDEAVGKYAQAEIHVAQVGVQQTAPGGKDATAIARGDARQAAMEEALSPAGAATAPQALNAASSHAEGIARHNIQLTISHEKDFAVAVVVVEG